VPRRVINFVNLQTDIDNLAYYVSYGSAYYGHYVARTPGTLKQARAYVSPKLHIKVRAPALRVSAVTGCVYRRLKLARARQELAPEVLRRMFKCSSTAVRVTPRVRHRSCDHYLVCVHCFYRKIREELYRLQAVIEPRHTLASVVMPVYSGKSLTPTVGDAQILRHYGDNIRVARQHMPGWEYATAFPVLEYHQDGPVKRWILTYVVYGVFANEDAIPEIGRLGVDCAIDAGRDWRVRQAQAPEALGALTRKRLRFPTRVLWTPAADSELKQLVDIQAHVRVRHFGYRRHDQ